MCCNAADFFVVRIAGLQGDDDKRGGVQLFFFFTHPFFLVLQSLCGVTDEIVSVIFSSPLCKWPVITATGTVSNFKLASVFSTDQDTSIHAGASPAATDSSDDSSDDDDKPAAGEEGDDTESNSLPHASACFILVRLTTMCVSPNPDHCQAVHSNILELLERADSILCQGASVAGTPNGCAAAEKVVESQLHELRRFSPPATHNDAATSSADATTHGATATAPSAQQRASSTDCEKTSAALEVLLEERRRLIREHVRTCNTINSAALCEFVMRSALAAVGFLRRPNLSEPCEDLQAALKALIKKMCLEWIPRMAFVQFCLGARQTWPLAAAAVQASASLAARASEALQEMVWHSQHTSKVEAEADEQAAASHSDGKTHDVRDEGQPLVLACRAVKLRAHYSLCECARLNAAVTDDDKRAAPQLRTCGANECCECKDWKSRLLHEQPSSVFLRYMGPGESGPPKHAMDRLLELVKGTDSRPLTFPELAEAARKHLHPLDVPTPFRNISRASITRALQHTSAGADITVLILHCPRSRASDKYGGVAHRTDSVDTLSCQLPTDDEDVDADADTTTRVDACATTRVLASLIAAARQTNSRSKARNVNRAVIALDCMPQCAASIHGHVHGTDDQAQVTFSHRGSCDRRRAATMAERDGDRKPIWIGEDATRDEPALKRYVDVLLASIVTSLAGVVNVNPVAADDGDEPPGVSLRFIPCGSAARHLVPSLSDLKKVAEKARLPATVERIDLPHLCLAASAGCDDERKRHVGAHIATAICSVFAAVVFDADADAATACRQAASVELTRCLDVDPLPAYNDKLHTAANSIEWAAGRPRVPALTPLPRSTGLEGAFLDFDVKDLLRIQCIADGHGKKATSSLPASKSMLLMYKALKSAVCCVLETLESCDSKTPGRTSDWTAALSSIGAALSTKLEDELQLPSGVPESLATFVDWLRELDAVHTQAYCLNVCITLLKHNNECEASRAVFQRLQQIRACEHRDEQSVHSPCRCVCIVQKVDRSRLQALADAHAAGLFEDVHVSTRTYAEHKLSILDNVFLNGLMDPDAVLARLADTDRTSDVMTVIRNEQGQLYTTPLRRQAHHTIDDEGYRANMLLTGTLRVSGASIQLLMSNKAPTKGIKSSCTHGRTRKKNVAASASVHDLPFARRQMWLHEDGVDPRLLLCKANQSTLERHLIPCMRLADVTTIYDQFVKWCLKKPDDFERSPNSLSGINRLTQLCGDVLRKKEKVTPEEFRRAKDSIELVSSADPTVHLSSPTANPFLLLERIVFDPVSFGLFSLPMAITQFQSDVGEPVEMCSLFHGDRQTPSLSPGALIEKLGARENEQLRQLLLQRYGQAQLYQHCIARTGDHSSGVPPVRIACDPGKVELLAGQMSASGMPFKLTNRQYRHWQRLRATNLFRDVIRSAALLPMKASSVNEDAQSRMSLLEFVQLPPTRDALAAAQRQEQLSEEAYAVIETVVPQLSSLFFSCGRHPRYRYQRATQELLDPLARQTTSYPTRLKLHMKFQVAMRELLKAVHCSVEWAAARSLKLAERRSAFDKAAGYIAVNAAITAALQKGHYAHAGDGDVVHSSCDDEDGEDNVDANAVPMQLDNTCASLRDCDGDTIMRYTEAEDQAADEARGNSSAPGSINCRHDTDDRVFAPLSPSTDPRQQCDFVKEVLSLLPCKFHRQARIAILQKLQRSGDKQNSRAEKLNRLAESTKAREAGSRQPSSPPPHQPQDPLVRPLYSSSMSTSDRLAKKKKFKEVVVSPEDAPKTPAFCVRGVVGNRSKGAARHVGPAGHTMMLRRLQQLNPQWMQWRECNEDRTSKTQMGSYFRQVPGRGKSTRLLADGSVIMSPYTHETVQEARLPMVSKKRKWIRRLKRLRDMTEEEKKERARKKEKERQGSSVQKNQQCLMKDGPAEEKENKSGNGQQLARVRGLIHTSKVCNEHITCMNGAKACFDQQTCEQKEETATPTSATTTTTTTTGTEVAHPTQQLFQQSANKEEPKYVFYQARDLAAGVNTDWSDFHSRVFGRRPDMLVKRTQMGLQLK